MKHLLLAIFLITTPLPVFALDYDDCDSGTAECSCPELDASAVDQSSVSSVLECHDACAALAPFGDILGGEITYYSAQCTVDGTLTTLAQGLVESVYDYEDCDSGTAECSCPDVPASGLDQPTIASVDECEDACEGLDPFDEVYGQEIRGYMVQCQISGSTTTIGQGSFGDDLIETDPDAVTTTTEIDTFYQAPELNVEIPGLEFTPAYKEADVLKSNYLGEYIEAVYTWVLGAASLIAIVMLMLGGLQYMLARGGQGVGKAITRMKNAVIGIVLLFAAYTIAFAVNPGSLVFETLNISYINPQEYIDLSGDIASSVVISREYLPPDVLCDTQYSVEETVDSMIGHVAYRMGGKGGPPPYPAELSTSVDPYGVQYSTYCPEDNLCLDCSGFVDYVSQCAGLGSPGIGTVGIFTEESSERVSTCGDTSINQIGLNVGDLLGWSTTIVPEQTWGHVFIYVGDGQVADSAGSGREPGEAVSTKSVGWVCESYGEHLYVVRR